MDSTIEEWYQDENNKFHSMVTVFEGSLKTIFIDGVFMFYRAI